MLVIDRSKKASKNRKSQVERANYHFELVKTENGNEKIVCNQEISTWNISGFTQELKKQVLDRDGHKCFICEKTSNLHVHHIIPRIHGGEHKLENLITLCSGCHRSIEAGNLENAIYKCSKRAITIMKNKIKKLENIDQLTNKNSDLEG